LRNRRDILDHEPVRQKSLIDQLHDLLVNRVQPNRPKMFASYFHGSVDVDLSASFHFSHQTLNLKHQRHWRFRLLQLVSKFLILLASSPKETE